MATIDDLEAELRDGLDRGIDPDIVTVYGDQLQALGDVRGELIALDLEIEHAGSTPALARRRAELVESWLGRQRPNGTIRCGFLDLDATGAEPVDQVRFALGCRAARFVRSVTAAGPPKLLHDMVAAIAEAPRPFLSRVTLRQWSEREAPTIDGAVMQAFVRATPHLKALELDARRLFVDLAHPSLRRLRLSGFDAIASLATGQLALPELGELDLALQCHLASSKTAPLELMFELLGTHLPKLTTLDLSRNEPGFLDPHTLGGALDVFPLIAKIGCRDQLRALALPPLLSPNSLAQLRAALRGMPDLRELAIVRTKASEHALLSRNLARPELALHLGT